MQSRPLTQISLPIKIFDPNATLLQKCAMFLKTAPLYCERAALVEQIHESEAINNPEK